MSILMNYIFLLKRVTFWKSNSKKMLMRLAAIYTHTECYQPEVKLEWNNYVTIQGCIFPKKIFDGINILNIKS